MSTLGVVLVSFGCGFLVCFNVLVRPQRKLLQRWLDFYGDDLQAAQTRQRKRVPPDRKGSR